METKHTPTPWERRCFLIVGADKRPVAHTGNCGREPNEANQSEANAAFIVRACNAHDELVKITEGLSANVQVLMNVIKDPNGGSEMAKKMILLVAQQTVADANTALAKARGGGIDVR